MSNQSTLIIAEAGVNHNGSMDLACELIDAAVKAGVDIVKFQTFKAENLASKNAPKADYQLEQTERDETQFEMLRKLELSEEDHIRLIAYCSEKNVKFLSTPFDLDSLRLLDKKFDLDIIKLGSGELTNAPLLLAAAQTQKKIILSTGMSNIDEIQEALGVLAFGYSKVEEGPSKKAFKIAYSDLAKRKLLKQKVCLLHCTTQYPTPFEDVNLRAMDSMKEAFGLDVGYSDHTPGIAVSLAAVARGAMVIEKHFTLDKSMEGPDHKASITPKELCDLVTSIRTIETALGNDLKTVSPSEVKNKEIARKSLVAKCDIQIGDVFTEHNLTVKRPGNGETPFKYWDVIGQKSKRTYLQDDMI